MVRRRRTTIMRIDWRLLAVLLLIGSAGAHAAAELDTGENMSREAELADLKIVREQYLSKEMAYVPATRKLAETFLAKLEADAGTHTRVEFAVALAELGALADNAHSGARLSDPRAAFARRLPLHFLWTSDALIVARATGAAADLAGARVIKIEGRSPESLYAGAKVLLGGNEAGRKHWLGEWIEGAGTLHALGLAALPDRLSMTLRLADGRVVDRTIEMARDADLPPAAESARFWFPDATPKEHDWKAALDTDALPLYLRDGNKPFRAEPIDALHALYVQFRSNEDEDGVSIKDFVAGVAKSIEATKPQNLVIDLRFDVGGNLLTTLDFMRTVANRVRGRTFVLIGPYTFSAGIISAAAIRKHGDRVTLVGDRIGDRVHFWSEGAKIDLPNSHISMRYTDGQFDLQDGCTGEPACMDDKYPIGEFGVNLDPDVFAPLTAEAYLAKRDPALEAVARELHASAPRGAAK
jgi:hypothetical protein